MENKNLTKTSTSKINIRYFVLILLVVITSCSLIVFDDINHYRGSVILKMERDSTTIDHHILYIKNTNEKYDIIRIRPGYGELFSVGDTL